ncbi:MAG: hypothetical protein RIT07_706, partial [Bacteroidota bacterium]
EEVMKAQQQKTQTKPRKPGGKK